ncbi:L,D-transpeptidase [Antarcticimicrobium luteum]|uniref:L,D-transpeptidase n=1 Tax=Antarcticimicrobium luteum TaxID=2547397 RepID=A0A4R5USQ1_9RHOB|nr:L,D-transpeptidase [Antarcticimicrobium luteum]TDK42158.1 L,D-transpeptidase [Antarcticimicrobium luteum]
MNGRRRHLLRPVLWLGAALCAVLALCGQTFADPLEAWIDKSAQTMTVYIDHRPAYLWAVSTGRPGKETPSGTFQPQSLARMHYSTLYDNAPMPFSIFFSGDYAIHGTTETARLGRPASAGCIRLHPEYARILFGLVRAIGPERTLIVIRD